jgi:hypothetical protein
VPSRSPSSVSEETAAALLNSTPLVHWSGPVTHRNNDVVRAWDRILGVIAHIRCEEMPAMCGRGAVAATRLLSTLWKGPHQSVCLSTLDTMPGFGGP